MKSALSRFARRTFAPSADTFDYSMQTLHTRIDALTTLLEASQYLHYDAKASAVSQSEVLSLLGLVQPMRADNQTKRRVGSEHDGGYVMLDDFAGINTALSLGILDNDDWDIEIANKGIAVRQYDFSIEKAPTQHENMVFFPLKIGTIDDEGNRTVETIVRGLPASKAQNLLLKMDIEGSEWDVFLATSPATMKRFRQIVCEFHFVERIWDRSVFGLVQAVFSKLATTHQCVHIHANNYGKLANVANVPVPQFLELTFASRDTYTFSANTGVFPSAEDRPNCPGVADIFLGSASFSA